MTGSTRARIYHPIVTHGPVRGPVHIKFNKKNSTRYVVAVLGGVGYWVVSGIPPIERCF
jgi:hypothetical protein